MYFLRVPMPNYPAPRAKPARLEFSSLPGGGRVLLLHGESVGAVAERCAEAACRCIARCGGQGIEYCYINPVKHGHMSRERDWPHSSFHRDVQHGLFPEDWAGGVEEIPGIE